MRLIEYDPKVDRSSQLRINPNSGIITKIKVNDSTAEQESQLLLEWERRLKEFSSAELKIITPEVLGTTRNKIKMEYLPYETVESLLANNMLSTSEKQQLSNHFTTLCDFKMTKGLLHGNIDLSHFLYKPQEGPRDKAIIIILNPQQCHSISNSRKAVTDENNILLSLITEAS